jgi:hypothetical protein
MNETVIQQPAGMTLNAGPTTRPLRKKRSSAFYGYSALTFFLLLGWLVRDRQIVNPETGIGYWLGIVGGSIMLFLLLYPLRKRFRILSIFGSTRHWFRLHMVLGLVGPLLVLYHCNFQLGSFNSKVALYCMLLVAGSGIIGRHFYAKIHHGLYGRKTSLQELQQELSSSREKGRGLATIMPTVATRLQELSNEVQGCQITQTLGVRRSLKWAFARHFIRLRLWFTAKRELGIAAQKSETIRRDQKRLRKATNKYIRNYTVLLGRVASFSLYERLFALWHVFHLPFFFMLVLSALVHVLAVHMY